MLKAYPTMRPGRDAILLTADAHKDATAGFFYYPAWRRDGTQGRSPTNRGAFTKDTAQCGGNRGLADRQRGSARPIEYAILRRHAKGNHRSA